ncbi:DnaD domain-containing protein [Kurthia sibirica]|uniref:DNA replication protein n=1 Tax=Kurthia sibirica TaxID=202750 RepID=A0A2U3AI65_9BACL|nr:DnaD domain-containing protein [Kurthia sibirica]PWI24225.1 DNA replication protein [Kurthia sibirica]GEK34122.1 DNA replication protein DnaD [Kurthia sibirica]
MQSDKERLQVWISSGNVAIPQLFFKYYKKLKISDEEAMLLLQIHSFIEQGIDFPSHTDIAIRMDIPEQQVMFCLQALLKKGFVDIQQGVNQNNVLYEKMSLYPVWMRLLDCDQTEEIVKEEKQDHLNEGKLFQMFEQEFGRLLSPIEIEMVAMWLDQDQHSPELIRQALKEAVLSDKINLKYIDRILFEWKKKNVKTSKEAMKQSKNFREHTVKPVAGINAADMSQTTKKPPFYNWLEERE